MGLWDHHGYVYVFNYLCLQRTAATEVSSTNLRFGAWNKIIHTHSTHTKSVRTAWAKRHAEYYYHSFGYSFCLKNVALSIYPGLFLLPPKIPSTIWLTHFNFDNKWIFHRYSWTISPKQYALTNIPIPYHLRLFLHFLHILSYLSCASLPLGVTGIQDIATSLVCWSGWNYMDFCYLFCDWESISNFPNNLNVFSVCFPLFFFVSTGRK